MIVIKSQEARFTRLGSQDAIRYRGYFFVLKMLFSLIATVSYGCYNEPKKTHFFWAKKEQNIGLIPGFNQR